VLGVNRISRTPPWDPVAALGASARPPRSRASYFPRRMCGALGRQVRKHKEIMEAAATEPNAMGAKETGREEQHARQPKRMRKKELHRGTARAPLLSAKGWPSVQLRAEENPTADPPPTGLRIGVYLGAGDLVARRVPLIRLSRCRSLALALAGANRA
jgi:hypothetical protein